MLGTFVSATTAAAAATAAMRGFVFFRRFVFCVIKNHNKLLKKMNLKSIFDLGSKSFFARVYKRYYYSSPNLLSINLVISCIAFFSSEPEAVTFMVVPFEAESIINPIIERPLTTIPMRSTSIFDENVSANFTKAAAARAWTRFIFFISSSLVIDISL